MKTSEGERWFLASKAAAPVQRQSLDPHRGDNTGFQEKPYGGCKRKRTEEEKGCAFLESGELSQLGPEGELR